ncbi:MAG TPA: glycosyltransferase family 4 protein [Candidatus Luteococcus avicola]|nr:glycosyltransferase family 4 protein [Candidatus Luteococcus avicola]
MADPSLLVRNAPVALSVVTKHAGRGRQALSSAVLRALPRGARSRVSGMVGRVDPVAAQLALASCGNTASAVESLVGLASRGDAALTVRAADALQVLHRPDRARELLEGLPEPHPRGYAVVMAGLFAGEGHLHEALGTLTDAKGSRAVALRRQLSGELDALQTSRRIIHSTGSGTVVGGARNVERVMHLVTTALPEAQSGYTVRTQSIAEQQVAAGISADVVTRVGFPVDQGHPAASPSVTVRGVRYHRLLPARRLPAGAGSRLDLAVELVDDLVTRTCPSLLHAHSKHDNAQVAIAVARRHELPVVYEVRGFLEETWRTRGGSVDTDQYRLSRQAELDCMLAADRVVTLSRSMRDEIVDRGVPVDKVDVVPNAVADDLLAKPADRDTARAALGLAPDALVVGFSGTVNAYEGLETVVRALCQLDDPRVHLLVVGSGPALAEVRRLAAPLGDRGHFTGRVPHARVREHLAAMDLFVVPRSQTPVTLLVPPLKHLEAMAAGVPVLASDLPPLRETADDSGCVHLAPADDVTAWADAITGELASVDALRARGAAGRKWVREERTWSRNAEAYQVTYSKARTAPTGPVAP